MHPETSIPGSSPGVHIWRSLFSCFVGIEKVNFTLFLPTTEFDDRYDWSPHVTEERRAFSTIPSSDYRKGKPSHSHSRLPRSTLGMPGTMTPYLSTKYNGERRLVFYDSGFPKTLVLSLTKTNLRVAGFVTVF